MDGMALNGHISSTVHENGCQEADQMITLIEEPEFEDRGEDNDSSLVHVLESSEYPKLSKTFEVPKFISEVSVQRSNPHCLVCNAKLGVSARGATSIFNELKTTSRQLAFSEFLGSIIKATLEQDSVHSDIICKKCFKIIDDVDALEGQLELIKQDITNKYMRTLALMCHEANGDGVLADDFEFEEAPVLEKDDKEFKMYSSSSRGHSRRGRRSRGRGRSSDLVKLEVKEEMDDSITCFEVNEGSDLLSLQEGVGPATAIVDADKMSKEADGGKESSGFSTVVAIEVDGLDLDSNDDTMQVGGVVLPCLGRSSSWLSVNKYAKAKGEQKYKCRYCGTVMQQLSDIKEHLHSHHQDRLFECEVCEQVLPDKSSLLEHLEQHVLSGQKPYLCSFCTRSYALPRQLKEHQRIHINETIACLHCPKRIKCPKALQEHMSTHTGYRPYSCNLCTKSFTSKHILKAHLKTHEVRNRPFRCKVCMKHFLTSHHLQEHMHVHQDKKNYICESCGKAFATQRSLDLHSVTHSGVKNYMCSICNKAFARKAEVEDHERIHTGEKPFQCEFCGATFSQRSNLLSHKKAIHFKEKKYRCTECTKAFKRRRLLVYHMMSVHTGERPYKCSHCSASFVYPEHYKKHIRIHTGEKPFKCEICGKAFNSRDNRNAHKFIHSDKKPYECLLCCFGFMRKPQLVAHIQQHGQTDNVTKYIKINPPSVVDTESMSSERSPALHSLKIDEEQSLEMTLYGHQSSVSQDMEAVEVVQRDSSSLDGEVSRYIIHTADSESSDRDENVGVGHLLASLQGQVVEVRADELDRYSELTQEQLNQVAQVAAQVVASHGSGGSIVQEVTLQNGIQGPFQIHIEQGDKEELSLSEGSSHVLQEVTASLIPSSGSSLVPGQIFRAVTTKTSGSTGTVRLRPLEKLFGN